MHQSQQRLSLPILGLALLGLALASNPDAAPACDPGKPGSELDQVEAKSVYDCLADSLQAGYATGPKRWVPAEFVSDYPSWTQASTAPAVPGFHDGRFLMTYVNDIGAEMYLAYAEDPVVPVGTRLAKESFEVDLEGKVQKGPLFMMEKVTAGTSPETDDWFYYLVAPDGRPQAVNVFTACSECHQTSFSFQGGMGYPLEEVRVGY